MVKTDEFERTILKLLGSQRRPLSTSKIASKTRMDWATAKAKLLSLHRKGKVQAKKVSIRKTGIPGINEKRVPSKILWSTRKIK